MAQVPIGDILPEVSSGVSKARGVVLSAKHQSLAPGDENQGEPASDAAGKVVPRGAVGDEIPCEPRCLSRRRPVAREVQAKARIRVRRRHIMAADVTGGGAKCVRRPSINACCQKK
jgi:hypothetical protein